MSRFRRAALAALVVIPVTLSAQQPAPFEFSIRNIMRGPEVYGREPQNIRWSLDGQWIYFMWLEPGADWRLPLKQYRVRAQAGAKPEVVAPSEVPAVQFADAGARTVDGRKRLYVEGGTIVVHDVPTKTTRIVSQTLEPKTNVTFSADGRQVFYTAANNVFAIALDSGWVRQLTDIRVQGGADTSRGGRGAAGRGSVLSGATDSATQRAVLERQQRELFQVVRDRAFQDSVNRASGRGGAAGGRGAAAAPTVFPTGFTPPAIRTLNLAANERINAISVSPSGRSALLSTAIPAPGATLNTMVPSWVTASGYVEEINGRTKVGDVLQATGKLLWMRVPSGETETLRLTGDRPANTGFFGWNETGSAAILVSASSDFKRRWIHTVTADSGRASLIEELVDSAWVGGPCSRCVGWFDGGRRVYYVSEADGYAHLYTASANGSDRKQLTSGKFEVMSVQLSNDGRSFYMTTNEGSPFEQHFFRMSVAGGARERLTARPGGHTVTLSPDQGMMADLHSTPNRPPELFVQRTAAGAPAAQLTTSPTASWLAFDWKVPEIVMIPASDGVQVPARIYRPSDVGATPNGAGVIFVHGAGYLHNVHNYWSTYSREYMFNQFLASKGYTVLDIDYRGSAGYGRDWRTAIYRHMGGRDLQDHVDGSRYLQKTHGIDPERVGIYGGSYGGFITLMALFTEPKWFGAGAALRSVTDWAHYNHGYTGAILNLPHTDSLAYRRSSPIYFAEGLEDPLLMLHGMVDVNVHFQDIVRLAQRLIELGKTNWSLQPYPVEDHAFIRPDSWTDEYTRIFELFERTIAKR
ncbi:MAG TPA: prolyl oligopeptidase family serine peptidase [Gemmatimonadaceae bacterium]|nr:prolyl oligopeptidase family serine peptidase [Gemmatimonadaceae bacterium]